MKVGFVSDVHGNLFALKSVLEEIKDLDKIFCSGDLVGYNPFPNEVINLIREKNISSVLGNHDLGVLNSETTGFNYEAKKAIEWTINELGNDELSFLRNLPKKIETSIDDVDLYVTHGSPSSISEYVFPDTVSLKLRGLLEETESDVLVLGHTHIPMVKKFPEGYVVNPGSVGQPRDGDDRASYLVFDSEEMSFSNQRVGYDIDKVVKEIENSELPNSLGKRLFVGR